jgi:hypothetical protein
MSGSSLARGRLRALGFLKRFLGGASNDEPTITEVLADSDDGDLFAELDVVGESYRQEALGRVAGPKQHDGVRRRVGVALRCEPDNPHDCNAVRVEVMGQHVGYIGRDQAEMLGPAMQSKCRGAVEAVGVIVGGWDRGGDDTGSYGIRVWLTEQDVTRLGVRADRLDPRLRAPWPDVSAAGDGEARVSPSQADIEAGRYGSEVTVTCEEHYQDAIGSTMPAGWDPDRTWPLVVELGVVESNPHTTHGTRCVEVRLADGRTVGYFTPKMSERHLAMVEKLRADGKRVTALATSRRETKRDGAAWNLKVAIAG